MLNPFKKSYIKLLLHLEQQYKKLSSLVNTDEFAKQ